MAVARFPGRGGGALVGEEGVAAGARARVTVARARG